MLRERVSETTQSTGAGPMILLGPSPGHYGFFQSFGYDAKFYYVIENTANSEENEFGIGFISSQTGMLVREKLIRSPTNEFISFSEGIKRVYNTAPASAFNSANALIAAILL